MHRAAKNYKDSKCGKYKYKRVTFKKTFYGEIREYKVSPGKPPLRIYFAVRLPGEYVHTRFAWAFDKQTVAFLRTFKPSHIGVLVTTDVKRRDVRQKRKIKEIWVTTIDRFNAQLIEENDWSWAGHVGTAPGAKGKLGASQWAIPMAAFSAYVRDFTEKEILRSMSIGGGK